MPNEFVIKNGFFSQGDSNITGSFTVTSASSVELQVTNTGVTLGNISTDTHRATGSVNITGSLNITGTETVTGDLTAQSNIIAQGNITISNNTSQRIILRSGSIDNTTVTSGSSVLNALNISDNARTNI